MFFGPGETAGRPRERTKNHFSGWSWLLLAVVLALLAALGRASLSADLEEELLRERLAVEQQAYLLAEVLSNELDTQHYSGAEAHLRRSAKANPGIARIELVMANGFILARHEREQAAEGGFMLQMPVSHGPQSLAMLNVLVDLQDTHQRQEQLGSRLRWVFAGFSLLSFLLLYLALQRQREAQRRIENEGNWRAIVDAEPECVKLVDRAGKLLDMNAAGLAMLEADSVSSVNAKPLLDYIDPRYRESFAQLHQHVVQGGSGMLQFEITGLKGTRRWMETHAVPLRDAEGKVGALLGVTRDITERKRSEQELRRVQAQLQRSLEASNASLWELDLASREVELSEGWAKLIGAPAGRTRTTSDELFLLIHPDDREAAKRASVAALKGGDEYLVEYRVRSLSGEWRWILSRGRVLERDAGGRALRMAGTSLDITERKTAEGALVRSEQRFRGLASLTSDWYWEQDAELRFTYFSQASRSSERIGLRRWEIPNNSTESGDWSRHRADLEARPPFRDLLLKRREGGRVRYIATSGMPTFDERGRFTGYQGVASDVTERVSAKLELAASEARFRDFAVATGDWFWETDPQHRFVWVSEGMSRMTGTPEGNYLGKHPRDLAEPGTDFTAEPWKSFLAALERHEPYRDFLFRRAGQSKPIWVKASGKPFFDEAGRCLGYRGSSADVTQMIEAEHRASLAVERLSSAIEHLDEAVLLTGIYDRIVVANRAFRQLNANVAQFLEPNTPFEEFLRASIVAGNAPEAAGREEEWIAQRMEMHRNPAGPFELQADGRWLLAREQRLPDGGTILFAVDVTESREARERIEQLNAELEARVVQRTAELAEANRDLDSFNYSVSHDLRQPLGAIAGFAELLSERRAVKRSREAREYAQEIEANAERMTRMIEGLLRFSGAGRGALRRAPVDMRRLVDDVLHDAAARAPLRAEVRIGELPAAYGDEDLLRHVWANLIGNALKYSAAHAAPRIDIAGVRWGKSLEYVVRDNGIGFDMETSGGLFSVFHRLDGSARFEGSGVGLAIAQRIVTRHGGRISAESAPGRGATFTFTLPSRTAA